MTDDDTRTEQPADVTGAPDAQAAPEAPPAPPGPKMPTPPSPSDMAALMEKVFLMGAGAASLTREKIDAFSADLVERGKASKGEAKEVADWMTEQAKRQATAVESAFGSESQKAASAGGVATRKDIEALQEQITELKAMIASSRGVQTD